MVKRRLAGAIRRLAKDASLRTGLWNNLFFNVYPYMFDPKQLVFLIERVQDAGQVPGCFVEAGVAWGATTALLNRTMNQEGIERPYYAIDTFSGFIEEQVSYEIETLGKPAEIAHGFAENRQAWFDKSMRLHHFARVKSIQADVAEFPFSSIAPIAFCLLDVDLYHPIRRALPSIHEALAPGGVIVVDDCKPNYIWEGALKAYEEFVAEKGLPREIAAERLGIVRA